MSQPPGSSASLFGGTTASSSSSASVNANHTPIVPPSTNTSASNAIVAAVTEAPPIQPTTALSVTRAVSTPHKKPTSKHYSEMVTVVVGDSKQPFVLHKGLLCFYSDFFRAAFEGSFKESTERKIDLPDVGIDVFKAFQVWLYSQSLCNFEDPQDSSQPPTFPQWHVMALLWVFGDKYQIPLLQNSVIDALMDRIKETQAFHTVIVQVAYQQTMQASPLRRFAIDRCVFTAHHGPGEDSIFAENRLGSWSKEAFVDFARCMSDAWKNKLPKAVMPQRDKCHYHIHASGEHC
ncbi:hypothetical protein E4T50_02498 [Aureobasidium sp. EXF-12298]|nr:hypothetical protein E4T50_02498 [Aureobasidium sp. EXF-12298]KAI4759559.1 hypothetical protein E4T51_07402 [Aureobasidium sp. EXF-12344]KAI4782742.1 hypothetical protein E4T52_02334 [Aureobasidium sp. EXF-3400]